MDSKNPLLESVHGSEPRPADASRANLQQTAVDEVAVYRSRWYILAVFSLLACLQGWAWTIPGSNSVSLKGIYDINDNVIQLLLNYGPIFFIPMTLPFAWWLDQPNGLRGCTLVGFALVVGGCVCRLVATTQQPWSITLLHLSYVFNAIAGPVAMGCVSKVAENWFPAAERATATAIAAEVNILGGSFAFTVGPAMVPTADVHANTRYNILLLILAAVPALCALVYFPSRPPRPPSLSAAKHSHESAFTLGQFWGSLKLLARNRNFVVLTLAYGITNGMCAAWSSTLSLILKTVIAEDTRRQTIAGWIGFTQSVGGNLLGLLAGRVVDRFRHHKAIVVTLLSISAAGFLYFAAVAQPLLPASAYDGDWGIAQAWIAATIGGMFLSATIPVMFELGVESVYPAVPEGVTVMVMCWVNNLGSLCLLFVPIEDAATAFNYIVAGTTVAAAVGTLLFLKQQNNRLTVDEKVVPVEASLVDAAEDSLSSEGGFVRLLDGAAAGPVLQHHHDAAPAGVRAALMTGDGFGGVGHTTSAKMVELA